MIQPSHSTLPASRCFLFYIPPFLLYGAWFPTPMNLALAILLSGLTACRLILALAHFAPSHYSRAVRPAHSGNGHRLSPSPMPRNSRFGRSVPASRAPRIPTARTLCAPRIATARTLRNLLPSLLLYALLFSGLSHFSKAALLPAAPAFLLPILLSAALLLFDSAPKAGNTLQRFTALSAPPVFLLLISSLLAISHKPFPPASHDLQEFFELLSASALKTLCPKHMVAPYIICLLLWLLPSLALLPEKTLCRSVACLRKPVLTATLLLTLLYFLSGLALGPHTSTFFDYPWYTAAGLDRSAAYLTRSEWLPCSALLLSTAPGMLLFLRRAGSALRLRTFPRRKSSIFFKNTEN